jgi:hypothetical protein
VYFVPIWHLDQPLSALLAKLDNYLKLLMFYANPLTLLVFMVLGNA